MFLLTRVVCSLCFGALLVAPSATPAQQRPIDTVAAERETRHSTPEWLSMAPHLPDPATGTPEQLELAADVMRARRMPEDALDFYHFALVRGGDESVLFARIGITELELRQPNLARAAFRRSLQLRPKDADTWNNLGAAEYSVADFHAAITDYRRAIKLNKRRASFYANLGTAYFDLKDYESAQKQYAAAFAIDPEVFRRAGFGGIEAHVLSPEDRGRFCFEMARLAAKAHQDEAVMHWLAQASEDGYDVGQQINAAREFDTYRKDPRLLLILKNAKAMRGHDLTASTPAPALPAEAKN